MPTRVLIVDDSVVVRRILSAFVSEDSDLELAGVASNGSIALQKLTQTSVDIVVMDVEMPGMDGIEAVTQLRARWPKLPVLMCSSITARGADATLRALAAGATDYVAKPTSLQAAGSSSEFTREFLGKLRALGSQARPTTRPPILQTAATTPGQARPLIRRTPPAKPAVLAIGCSTGGPNALATVFAGLPGEIGVPIVITQHMPPLFTRMLAERLTANSAIQTKEAAEGDEILPNRAYIAPGDYHLTFTRDGNRVVASLNKNPPEHSCRPAVDVMFRSVASVWKHNAIASVLTGMGRDGALGAREITSAGGWVVTQSPSSCVIPSMPGAVVELGASDETVDLEQLGAHFALRCRGQSPSSKAPSIQSR
jgi:two-component system chemotaxis response regulator CheB